MMLEGRFFKMFIKSVLAVRDIVKLHVDEDGFSVTAVDPANVYMVNAKIPQSIFSTYDCGDGRVVGVDFNKLHRLKVKDDDLVDIQFTDKTIKLFTGNITYEVELYEPSFASREPKQPDIEYTSSVMVDTKELLRFMKIPISDEIAFYSNETGFYAEMEGDVDKAVMTLSDESFEEAKSYFAVSILEELLKPLGATAKLSIGTDIPLRLVYDVDVEITYYLAPRLRE